MRIGVLALQGAFAEHIFVLKKLGIETVELRKKSNLDMSLDGLVLPGGESTTQGKLLRELGMYDTIKEWIQKGIPVFATCAGMILLAEDISNDERSYFRTLPVTVKRNAYGRQLGSFRCMEDFKGIGKIPMTFIRAPYIEDVGKDVEVMAEVDGNIVAVRYGKQLALSFHPELDDSRLIYEYFIEEIVNVNR
ncbi:MAG: pyridoxal 5'-phosphate synthase glutaminase subunit PdxT [Hornefia sp.]|nr:pyridoxal 5'-phosphate synthase glutaminase subunit PdxT [Hornefia sp.]